MKNRALTLLALASATLVSVPALQGCYGNFALTKKVYTWNGTLGDKWVKSIAMVAMNIVPVYPVAATADAVVLNLIEFWTGTNPMAMAPGERETRVVRIEERDYRMVATRNRVDLVPLEDPAQAVGISYEPRSGSWFAETREVHRLIARETAGSLDLYLADGRVETLRD